MKGSHIAIILLLGVVAYLAYQAYRRTPAWMEREQGRAARLAQEISAQTGGIALVPQVLPQGWVKGA